ncbi:MAG: hypothetical protein JO029_01900 [Candidatus Eremiobacteraeota bacterium]|nr:hypothetical protein [Candidatus Eremiobacteraeota bacterium]MBV8582566.1 hypothetical protein [Candidatus Eremiobacteraeota bacterium]
MFFWKKPKDEETEFGELDSIVGSGGGGIVDSIRHALQRDDLLPEDRRELEAALKRLSEPPADA